MMGTVARLATAGCLLHFLGGQMALAQSAGAEDVFTLGTIVVQDSGAQGGTSDRVTGAQAERTGRATLDDTLRTVPGVSVGNSGGSRNERLVFVRGFDRFQVPLSIDGIRVYLPADNRLDYGRFLTPDLAEVQVQKGYVSVLNGPGGMGGAINLVTQKPVKPFEGEFRLGAEAGNTGDISGRTGYVSLGTKQDLFYLQGSYLKRDSDGYYLSRDYEPRPQQGKGKRDHSDTDDSRVNLKAGFTPNETDEYVLSYTRQTGSKSAPYNVDQPIRGLVTAGTGATYQRDWGWPEWDIESLAFYSHTELGSGAYVATKVYRNNFDNVLSAYDDHTHSSQRERRAFDSTYDDTAYGMSLEAGANIGANDTLKGALHYRRDKHRAIQLSSPDVNAVYDPTEVSKENVWSLTVENTYRFSDSVSLVAGVSHDRSEVEMASRTDDDSGDPVGSSHATNWQMAALYTPGAGSEYHASLSSRTRFPTLFDRYSTRFGTAIPNPDLKSERALTAEIGYSGDLGPATVRTALFYSRVTDMIQSMRVGVNADGGDLSQSQNVGDGDFKGFEVGAALDLGENLILSGNYTYIYRSITDPVREGVRATDVPKHQAYLRLDWQATETLAIAPSLELAGARVSESAVQPTDPTRVAYSRIGGFGLMNLDAEWQAMEQTSVFFGIRNLFDRDYELVEGFPEPGRSFFVTTSVRF